MTKITCLHIITIILVTGLISSLFFKDGYPIGHDYKNQIISYEAVSSQMREGEIYPRWLANVNKGYGGTNLYFYPPFIYYSGFLIDLFTGFALSTTTILSINSTLLLLLSGLSFYIFARGISTPNISLITSILYIILPYHSWFEIYERNAMAELSSYIWIPLIFHCIRSHSLKLFRCRAGLAISYALLIVSHLPTAVFSSIFFIAYICLQTLSIKGGQVRLHYLLTSITILTIGIGLSAIYLYPSISLLGQTNSGYLWEGFYEYKNWFLWFNNNCPIEVACRNLFIIAIMQIILPIILLTLLILKKQKCNDSEKIKFIVLSALCFFLITPYSVFIWDLLPPLQKIQFPWRLLVMSDFLFVAIILTTLSDFKTILQDKKVYFFILVGLVSIPILILNIHIYSYVKDSWNPPLYKFQDSIRNKMLTQEHIPKNKNLTASFKELQQSKSVPLWTITSGKANITTLLKRPRKIILEIQAKKSFSLQIRQFYFPGWRIKRDSIDITEEVGLRDARPFGQIEMDLPEGKYSIIIHLQTLPEEKIGFWISFISILLLIGLIFIQRDNRKREP